MPAASILCFNRVFSSSSSFTTPRRYSNSSPADILLLRRRLFLICIARDAYLSVLRVCSWLTSAGDAHAMNSVSEFPPSESDSRRVSLELRYGTCVRALPSVSALTTLPSCSRPWLMLTPSAKRCPVAPVSFTRSEPARSTRCSLERRKWRSLGTAAAASRRTCCSSVSVTIACERELSLFILWAAVARAMPPRCSNAATSSRVRASSSVAPDT
mmetsp:Transcript_2737/g.7417  ORF Transcript_2737/g.7417 Transcript_2737/m.7417 type:complete len:214 (-) Transcript_2737:2060-2701(-)